LGDKAAILEGAVVDSVSGKPTSVRLAFLDQNGNGHVLNANGKYHMLLPAGKDLSIMVVGMGREERSQMAVNALRLDPGQEMQMDISLSKQ
jgi:cell division septal protein FtsQ